MLPINNIIELTNILSQIYSRENPDTKFVADCRVCDNLKIITTNLVAFTSKALKDNGITVENQNQYQVTITKVEGDADGHDNETN